MTPLERLNDSIPIQQSSIYVKLLLFEQLRYSGRRRRCSMVVFWQIGQRPPERVKPAPARPSGLLFDLVFSSGPERIHSVNCLLFSVESMVSGKPETVRESRDFISSAASGALVCVR